jgi:hypothetical protein
VNADGPGNVVLPEDPADKTGYAARSGEGSNQGTQIPPVNRDSSALSYCSGVTAYVEASVYRAVDSSSLELRNFLHFVSIENRKNFQEQGDRLIETAALDQAVVATKAARGNGKVDRRSARTIALEFCRILQSTNK